MFIRRFTAFKDALNTLTQAPLNRLAENGYGDVVFIEPIIILLLSLFNWFIILLLSSKFKAYFLVVLHETHDE